MKRLFSLILALILALSCFAGCSKEPETTEPSTETKTDATVPVAPGLELEEDGVVYKSLAQKAVVKTALAYLARGTRIQYDDTNMQIKDVDAQYRWQVGIRTSPEAYTSQWVGYTNCAAFTYDVYLAALGIKIGGFTTATLTEVSGKQRVYKYFPTGKETDEKKAEVEATFRSRLEIGDLIIIRYNGTKKGNGHAMLYVGSKVLENAQGHRGTAAEGTDSTGTGQDEKFTYDIIHSTGSNYNYTNQAEKYETKGSIQMMAVDSLFDPSTGRYVFEKLHSITIIRPLAVFNKDIPENTLNRLQNLDNMMAEKLCSHSSGITVNPGDTVTYTISVTNQNSQPVTLTVTDTVPEIATLVSADKTEVCSVSGDQLSWQLTVPANTTSSVSYVVQVKTDARPGQSLVADKGTVGGVNVSCPEVFVGRTLNRQEQDNLLTAVSDLASKSPLRGTELVNALYSKAIQEENILPEDFAGITNSVYQFANSVGYINEKSPYADAIAPGLLGGRNLLQRNVMSLDNPDQCLRLEGRRTRLPGAEQLVIGDVIIAEKSAKQADRKMYLFLGDRMLNLLSGTELEYKENQTCLEPLIAYQRFIVLRPSMLLDKQEQPQ